MRSFIIAILLLATIIAQAEPLPRCVRISLAGVTLGLFDQSFVRYDPRQHYYLLVHYGQEDDTVRAVLSPDINELKLTEDLAAHIETHDVQVPRPTNNVYIGASPQYIRHLLGRPNRSHYYGGPHRKRLFDYRAWVWLPPAGHPGMTCRVDYRAKYTFHGGRLRSIEYEIAPDAHGWFTNRLMRGHQGDHWFRASLTTGAFRTERHRVDTPVNKNQWLHIDGSEPRFAYDNYRRGTLLRQLPYREVYDFTIIVDGKHWPVPSRLWRDCFDPEIDYDIRAALSPDGQALDIDMDVPKSYQVIWHLRRDGRHWREFPSLERGRWPFKYRPSYTGPRHH